MASYVSPDYNPAYYELPIFQAPIETAFKVAQQKQAQFDAGLNQVKQQYQNMLNLELTNDNVIAKKDAYMEEAKRKLKSIVTADFSLQENVNVANSVYKPLTSDKDIILDLSYTKQNKSAESQLMADKTSKDEKQRAYVSSYNEEYIMRKKKELKTLSLEQLRNYTPAKYVRAVNFTEILNDAAQKMGYKHVEMKEDGIYFRKTEGGPAAFMGYNTFAQTQLAGNPQAQEYMRIMAEVDYERDLDTYEKIYGSRDLAKVEVAKKTLEDEAKYRKSLVEEQEKQNKSIEESILKFIEKAGGKEKIMQDPELQRIYLEYEEQFSNGQKQLERLKQRALELDPNNPSKNEEGLNPYQQNLKTASVSAVSFYQNLINRRVASNWALGVANINYKKEIQTNEAKIKQMDYEIKLLEKQAELAKEQNKEDGSGGKTKTKTKTEEGTNQNEEQIPFSPLGLDRTPVTISKYEKLKAEKSLSVKAKIENQKMAFQMLATSEDFSPYTSILNKIVESYNLIQEGKKDTDILSNLSEEQKEKIKQFAKASGIWEEGKEIKTASDLYKIATGYLEKNVKNSPEAQSYMALSRIEEIKIEGFEKIEKDLLEKVIKKDPEKYKMILRGDNSIMTEEEFVNFNFYAVISNPRFKRLIETAALTGNPLPHFEKTFTLKNFFSINNLRVPLKFMENVFLNLPFQYEKLAVDIYNTANELLKEKYDAIKQYFSKQYKEIENDINKKISKLIETDPTGLAARYFSGESDLGMSFRQLHLPFEDKDGVRNRSEEVVTRMLSEGNLGALLNKTNIVNLELGEDAEKNKKFLKIVSLINSGEDLKSKDGQLLYTPKGGVPVYKFKPSQEFMKYLRDTTFKDDNVATNIIDKIIQNGITFEGSLDPKIESQTKHYYSNVAMALGTKGSLNLFPDINEPGFSAEVIKVDNNTYMIKHNYMVDGKPVETKPQYIEVTKLDRTVSDIIRGMYSAYAAHLKRKQQDSKPTINAAQERQLLRQSLSL